MFEYYTTDNWHTTFYGYLGEFPCGRVILVKNYERIGGEDLLFYTYQYSDIYDRIITFTFDKDFDEIIVDIN